MSIQGIFATRMVLGLDEYIVKSATYLRLAAAAVFEGFDCRGAVEAQGILLQHFSKNPWSLTQFPDCKGGFFQLEFFGKKI